jgi:hypothetical protein
MLMMLDFRDYIRALMGMVGDASISLFLGLCPLKTRLMWLTRSRSQ